eukprot:10486961-Karenia_brevis.AAC.1
MPAPSARSGTWSRIACKLLRSASVQARQDMLNCAVESDKEISNTVAFKYKSPADRDMGTYVSNHVR